MKTDTITVPFSVSRAIRVFSPFENQVAKFCEESGFTWLRDCDAVFAFSFPSRFIKFLTFKDPHGKFFGGFGLFSFDEFGNVRAAEFFPVADETFFAFARSFDFAAPLGTPGHTPFSAPM